MKTYAFWGYMSNASASTDPQFLATKTISDYSLSISIIKNYGIMLVKWHFLNENFWYCTQDNWQAATDMAPSDVYLPISQPLCNPISLNVDWT